MVRPFPVNVAKLFLTTTLVLMFPGFPHAQQATADRDFGKGVGLYEVARFSEAVEAFKHSLKQNPDNAEAYYYLGNCYFKMYLYKDAVKAYKHATELKPSHFEAYNNLGTAYHELGEFKEAVKSYEEALRTKPDYLEAIFGLGVVYLELKNKEAALEQHKKLAAIDTERADRLYNYIIDKKISVPVLNGKAISLPQPLYPAQARAAHASGPVIVWVSIDEAGRVVSASAVKGHFLLRSAAVEAAKLARFSPTTLNGQPIKVTGLIVYNFVLDEARPPIPSSKLY